MRHFIKTTFVLFIGLTALPSVAQEPEQPKLGPLLQLFGAGTLGTTFYATCKPEAVDLSDEQLIILMQNNLTLRTLITGYLLAQNKDVPPPQMVAFTKATAMGLQVQAQNSIKEKGCDDAMWNDHLPVLKKLSTERLAKGKMRDEEVVLSSDDAKKMLESMK